ncbi:MAG TPA: DNA polymerase I [Steroidobacteraceae bacterium]|nr:DNA polymerase I [Steroidobacteraceae bacterium]
MTERRKLVLVDGSAYLYRAFHALPPLSNSRGEPTGAVLGVLNMLNKLVKDENPTLLAVVFDAPGKTFRDALFDAYKAQRQPMPDDLHRQIQPLRQAVEALGIPMLTVGGVEADDVIGTLAQRAAAAGIDVLISTSDKDMAQLVNEHITLVNTMSGTVLDRQGVKNKFDVYPEQIIDYLALVGDTSDNIPGVPKVGPKTAAKWLTEYGTVAKLLENAQAISGKVGENLRGSLKEIELSQKLAQIQCDVPLTIEVEQLKPGEPNVALLRELYTRLELRSLLRALSAEPQGEIEGTAPSIAPATAPRERTYELITSVAALDAWIERLRSASRMALHAMASTPDYMRAEWVGVSFAVESGHAAYVPFGHDYPGAPDQLSRDLVVQRLKPLLENAALPKLGHNTKFDAHVCARHGIQLAGVRFDSMLESYVWNSTATKHELDAVARKYLGFDPLSYEAVTGRGAKQLPFNQVALEPALSYAAEQADLALQLHEHLWPKLSGVETVRCVYETIEQPLSPVLQRMEQTGVLIDGAKLKEQSAQLARSMKEIEAQAHAAAGGPFNLDSPKQLQDVLFGKLAIPAMRKTASGQPSTAEDVLEELAESYELPRLILQYRAQTKLKSTYTDKLPLQINPRTGRVHTCYQQAVAATGRLSSADPNLQNIPIRTAEGRRIRQAFVPPQGSVIVAADYSQIELRIMAHLSGDAGLRKAFAEERDIHQATAAEVFGLPLDAVPSEQRRAAKAINFGLIYGMSAFGLASRLGISRGEAQRYVDLYFERYPGVRRYMDETRHQARQSGFVETVFGRRLYLQDINSRNAAMRQYAERSAINAPMQGTAADIIKRAMIAVDAWLAQSKLDARLIMQVHDELVFEVRRELVDEFAQPLRELMCRAADLDVPLKVEMGAGENWDEAH